MFSANVEDFAYSPILLCNSLTIISFFKFYISWNRRWGWSVRVRRGEAGRGVYEVGDVWGVVTRVVSGRGSLCW